MAENDTQEDEKFYSELDQDKTHASCCTCYTLVLLFCFILLVLIGTTFYLYRQISSEKITPLNLFSRTSLKDLTDRFDSLSFSDLSASTITLSEQDLNALIAGDLNIRNFILKDVQTAISPNEILVYGSLVKPINSKVVISLAPTIVDGKIKYIVTTTQAGKLNIPKFLLKQIEDNLNDSMTTKFELIYNKVTIEDVILQDRKMVMTVRAK